MILHDSLITVSVFKPRKSILSNPIFSSADMEYWVVTWSPVLNSGVCSVSGTSEITTPAACVEAWRVNPSKAFDVSTNFAIRGSVSASSLRRGSCLSAASSVMLSSIGINFAMRSTS